MKKLTKSKDKVISGVLGGIAEYFGWDPTLIRAAYVVISIAGIGSPILLYFILAIIMPK